MALREDPPEVPPDTCHDFHVERIDFVSRISDSGVTTGRHFPVPGILFSNVP